MRRAVARKNLRLVLVAQTVEPLLHLFHLPLQVVDLAGGLRRLVGFAGRGLTSAAREWGEHGEGALEHLHVAADLVFHRAEAAGLSWPLPEGLTEAELERIHEIGSVMAASVEKFFGQIMIKKLIEKFKKAGLQLTEPEDETTGRLSGKKFVFTGELKKWSRPEAAILVKKSGGDVLESVSKKTDFVVAGENAGSKYARALNLGVKVLNESEFKEMIDE